MALRMVGKLVSIPPAQRSVIDGITSVGTDIRDGFGTIGAALASGFDNILEAVEALGLSISEFASDFWDTAEEKFGRMEPTVPFVVGDDSFAGFGAIWHYVVSWLGYISGFISLILSVWSSLPYAMVVPVYACVTLILVFGIYRKFIS